jgi:hypothetical protein
VPAGSLPAGSLPAGSLPAGFLAACLFAARGLAGCALEAPCPASRAFGTPDAEACPFTACPSGARPSAVCCSTAGWASVTVERAFRTARLALIRPAISTGVRPMSASTSPRLACARNCSGIPNLRTGTSTSASPRASATAAPTPDARLLSSTTATRRCSAARPGSAGSTGLTQRGSTTVQLTPRASSRSAAWRHTGAITPTATRSTSGRSPRCRTSRPPTRSTAGTTGPTDSLGNRISVGASSTATASRSCAHSWSASRGAAILSPGTTWRMDMSHMPLCDAPSTPVTPARSSTKVTPQRCSATSISSWSKARFRKVAYTATTGCRPPVASPAADTAACCSAIPTSHTRSGNLSANFARPTGCSMAAVIATTSSRASPIRTISSPNTEVQEGPLDGARGSQVSGSITPTV